mgnify:CR=1 FL=1
MDFEQRLQEILARYGLNHPEPVLNPVEKSIILNWQRIPENARVVIWGAGDHTTQVLMELISFEEKNIVCFVDKNVKFHGKKIKGIPILPPSEITGKGIDYVVISSLSFRNEIAAEIREKYPWCKVVDFYDEVKENFHLSYDHCFYIFYRELYELRNRLAHAKRERARLLKEIIIKYLYIRDFCSARKYIQIYLEDGYEDADRLRDFGIELDELLIQLKAVLKARNSSDLAFFVFDSLRAKDVFSEQAKKTMPFLHALMGKSIVFTRAYSGSTYTAASFNSFLTGKKAVDDCLSNNSPIIFEDSVLLKSLQKEGYEFYQYGGIRFVKNEEGEESPFCVKGMTRKTKFEALPKRVWNYITDLAKAGSQPVFSILHLMESHWPFPNGHQKEQILFAGHPGVNFYHWKKEGKVPLEKIIRIKESALSYIDEQLSFYLDYLPENINLVILGDHGQVLGEHDAFWNVFTWYDEAIHAPVIYYNKHLKPQTSDALFSLGDLPLQILHILQHGEILEPECSYIEVQRDPIANPSFLNDEVFISELGAKFTRGYKVIRTINEKYVLYDDGSEEFVIPPDETTNLIAQPQYAEEIEKLRGYLSNKEFPYKTTAVEVK